MVAQVIPLPDLPSLARLAQQIAPCLQAGDCLALAGKLGAGKTAFARALIQGLGETGEVPSPTFTLLQIYETQRFPVYHYDLYRLKTPDELDELNWDEAQSDALILVEWPQRAGGRLPDGALQFHFTLDTKGDRCCRIEIPEAWRGRVPL